MSKLVVSVQVTACDSRLRDLSPNWGYYLENGIDQFDLGIMDFVREFILNLGIFNNKNIFHADCIYWRRKKK